MGDSLLQELLDSLIELPDDTKKAVTEDAIAGTAAMRWVPNPGPQTEAYFSEADETLYGGEAGGGKTDLLLGTALNKHRRAKIFRRIGKDVADLGDRLCGILGSNDGYNSQRHAWRDAKQRIELLGCEQESDKQRHKGNARDFFGFDELSDFLESQYVFIIGWNRSTDPGQRCRVVAGTNPPTTPEGRWIVRRWAPWLDKNHPNPAKDGELRWFLTIDGKDVEVDGPGPHAVEGRRALVKATSRTFIRSSLSDNPDLAGTNYEARLEALPEEERRAYRDGDFTVGLKDDDFQVIPTAWLELAMSRWQPQPPKGMAMTAMGVDVAQGGADMTVTAARYAGWYDQLACEPGKNTQNGRDVAAMVVKHRHGNCPVIVDCGGGWGSDTVVALTANGIDTVAYLGVAPSNATSRDGKIRFRNKRAEGYWRLREELDPSQEGGSPIALPPDELLKADLAAVKRKPMTTSGLLLESKDDVKLRLGRSPDRGDAVVMALAEGERAVARAMSRSGGGSGLQTTANRGYSGLKR